MPSAEDCQAELSPQPRVASPGIAAKSSHHEKDKTMSRKHFVKFAEHISCIIDEKERKSTAELVARVCSGFNYYFDYAKFMRACCVDAT